MSRASRSLRLAKCYIKTTKLTVQKNGFTTQQKLAEYLGLSLSTVSNFLNGRPVDSINFIEICFALNLDWKEMADFQNLDDVQSSTHQEINYTDYIQISPDEFLTYIKRPPIENHCYQTISKPGTLLRIKAPRRMGKSLLLNKIHEYALKENYVYVSLSLLWADNGILTNSNTFLKWFCCVIGQQLKQPNKLAEFWEDDLGDSYNCKIYFEEYLLESLKSPLVLALDDIETVLNHSKIAEDFFKILRAWNELAKTQLPWKNLRIVISYSTEIYIELDINHSPFNVGVPIELPEFTPDQIMELAKRHKLDCSTIGFDKKSVDNFYNLIGGHPYLIQRAISCLKQEQCTLKELLETASTDSGIYQDHLRGIFAYLKEFPELVEVMKKVLRESQENIVQLDPISTFKLQSLGLVKLENQGIKTASKLYQSYFSKYL
ncbi:MAG: AAA-like domain-containing protein [Cyanobacteria bacterium SBLK]|nr:AAA-like domain-containing protein [Cyanobacteria bacterium SBLK]